MKEEKRGIKTKIKNEKKGKKGKERGRENMKTIWEQEKGKYKSERGMRVWKRKIPRS